MLFCHLMLFSLKVMFEGMVYAVKWTAFRWREVLLMPKLHHPNILPLISMLMGDPIDLNLIFFKFNIYMWCKSTIICFIVTCYNFWLKSLPVRSTSKLHVYYQSFEVF